MLCYTRLHLSCSLFDFRGQVHTPASVFKLVFDKAISKFLMALDFVSSSRCHQHSC